MRALVLIGAFAAVACAPVPTPDTGDDPDLCRAEANRSLIGQNVAAVSFAADAKMAKATADSPEGRKKAAAQFKAAAQKKNQGPSL